MEVLSFYQCQCRLQLCLLNKCGAQTNTYAFHGHVLVLLQCNYDGLLMQCQHVSVLNVCRLLGLTHFIRTYVRT